MRMLSFTVLIDEFDHQFHSIAAWNLPGTPDVVGAGAQRWNEQRDQERNERIESEGNAVQMNDVQNPRSAARIPC